MDALLANELVMAQENPLQDAIMEVIRQKVALERESCAKLAQGYSDQFAKDARKCLSQMSADFWRQSSGVTGRIAEDIRARG